MLSSDQEARIRFAYRVYSTGNTYGAPAAAVRAADDLVRQITQGKPELPQIGSEEFTALAKTFLVKLEK